MDSLRVDKWLWAARFFKTRSLATEEINKGHVQIDQRDIKPARDIRVGDIISVQQGQVTRTIVVKGISAQRGPAPVAQALFEETAESLQRRALIAERNRLAPEPARTIEHGRPTKRDRRELQKDWNDRWSASID